MSERGTSKTVVVADLPRFGLGNLLLVWARALVYARTHDIPLYVYGWHRFRLGPWLRGERVKRLYGGYFDRQVSAANWWRTYFAFLLAQRAGQVTEERFLASEPPRRFVRFNGLPDPPDIFKGLHEHRDMIRSSLFEMLSPKIQSQLNAAPTPAVAMHIRRGDFQREGGKLFQLGGRISVTPIEYFVAAIKRIREEMDPTIPVTIFTDGTREELSEVLTLDKVRLADNNPDIVDLLLMSKSSFVVPSTLSTFSYWSCFLSDATILRFPYEDMRPIRPGFSSAYEGDVFAWPPPQA